MKGPRVESWRNPSLFDLLRSGAYVRFSNSYSLRGNPHNGTIYVYSPSSDISQTGTYEGMWNLSRDGLIDALRDISVNRSRR